MLAHCGRPPNDARNSPRKADDLNLELVVWPDAVGVADAAIEQYRIPPQVVAVTNDLASPHLKGTFYLGKGRLGAFRRVGESTSSPVTANISVLR